MVTLGFTAIGAPNPGYAVGIIGAHVLVVAGVLLVIAGGEPAQTYVCKAPGRHFPGASQTKRWGLGHNNRKCRPSTPRRTIGMTGT